LGSRRYESSRAARSCWASRAWDRGKVENRCRGFWGCDLCEKQNLISKFHESRGKVMGSNSYVHPLQRDFVDGVLVLVRLRRQAVAFVDGRVPAHLRAIAAGRCDEKVGLGSNLVGKIARCQEEPYVAQLPRGNGHLLSSPMILKPPFQLGYRNQFHCQFGGNTHRSPCARHSHSK
jgi:hypothetical protein